MPKLSAVISFFSRSCERVLLQVLWYFCKLEMFLEKLNERLVNSRNSYCAIMPALRGTPEREVESDRAIGLAECDTRMRGGRSVRCRGVFT